MLWIVAPPGTGEGLLFWSISRTISTAALLYNYFMQYELNGTQVFTRVDDN